MKRAKWMLTMTLMLLSGLAAAQLKSDDRTIAQDQTSNRSAITVNVPFDFLVGNRTFPAGIYKFRSLLNSIPNQASIDVLEVRSVVGRFYSALVTDVAAAPEPSQPRLVFVHIGGRTVLSEVWEGGKQAGCRLQNRYDQTPTVESKDEKVTLIASAGQR